MCLAVPGMLLEVAESDIPDLRTGKVDFGGIRKEVSLAFTPEAVPGDYVLVHVGFALAVIDPAEAKRTIAAFEEIERIELEIPG